MTRIPDAKEYRDRQLLHWVARGLRLLTPREARRAFALAAFMFVAAGVEAGSLSATVALVRILTEPDGALSAGWLLTVHGVLGHPSAAVFTGMIGVSAVVLTLASSATNWLALYLKHRFSASCHNRLARDQIAVVLAAPYEWHLSQNRTLIVRALYEDSKAWSNGIVLRLIGMTSELLTLVVAVILLVGLSDRLALLGFSVLALIAYAGFHIARPLMADAARRRIAAAQRIQVVASRVLSGLKDVKLAGREKYFADEFARATSSMSRAEVRLGLAHATPGAVAVALGQVALLGAALLLWWSGAPPGAITAQLALLAIVVAKAMPAANALASEAGALWNAVPYVESIYQLRDASRRIPRHEEHITVGTASFSAWRSVQLSRVGYRYPRSAEWALRDLDISFEQGRQYGLVGRSAAGKSTLVDILVGLLEPTEGELRIDGQALSRSSAKAWQRTIGYVPQALYISDQTLRENVAFGLPASKIDEGRVLECLRLAGLAEFATGGANGLELPLGDFGVRLSGGQRQRVVIARALYSRPGLLVFDEATSAIDALSEAEISRTLDDLRGVVTVIVIAHRLTTVIRCDELILLDHGRMVARGTYAELMNRSELFRALAGDPMIPRGGSSAASAD